MSGINDYKPGMIVYGKVTGIQPYGAFVSFLNDVSGLIHISELTNGYVKDINNFVKVDDYVMVKVIDVDKESKQLRLSLKALGQSSRKRQKKVVFLGMPENKIGFGSLKKQLPLWIKEREI